MPDPSASDPSTVPPGGDQLHATRIFLRPIANPFALGFVGLAGDTLVVAGSELGWIPPTDQMHVALIVMIFAPVLQVIACVFGFLARDAIAATGMGTLAGSWEIIGVVLLTSRPGSTSAALGTFLLLAGTGVLLSAATAAQSTIVPAIVMGLTGLRFVATGLYEIIATAPFKTASGVLGCVLAFAAMYGAWSLELEGTRHHPVLPTLRRGSGRQALEPSLAEQVAEVATEAGVRRQL